MASSELMPEATAPTGTGPRGDEAVKPGIDYRQIQQPTELRQPWHIPASGAATEAEELAHALGTFSRTTGALGEKINAQEGKAAGAQAGLSNQFQPKTGLAAITTFGQNYNAAAHVEYVANTQTSIETAIDAAEQAYPRDPVAFQNEVQAVKDATLKETPALYAPEIQTMFDRRIEAGRNRIQDQATKLGQEDAVAAYTGTQKTRFTTAVRTAADLPEDKASATIQQAVHDDNMMVDGLVSGGAISKERGDTIKAEALAKITEEVHLQHAQSVAGNWISTARTTQDITSGDRALAAYVNDPANSNEDKERIGAEYARQREQFEHQQGILHAPEVEKLASYIEQIPGEKEGRGGFGPDVLAQIDDARKKGWITTEYARSLTDRAALNSAKGKEDDEATYNVNQVWNGDAPKFDPKDPKAAKAVDTFFQTLTAANGFARGTNGYETLAVSTMQKTSIIPPVIRKGIIADLASGDPDRAAQAARLQERLYSANPRADIYEEDSKSAAFGDTLQRNLDAGMPAHQAYEMARGQVDAPRDVLEQRKMDYGAAVKTAVDKNPKKTNADMLQSKLNDSGIGGAHWYGNTPAPLAPTAMRAEYEGLTQEFFTRTGKIDQAQDLAFQQVQKTWHMTSINGQPEMMKFGPTAEETPIIREGIAQTLKAYGHADDPSTVKLTPGPRTALSQGDLWNLTDAKGDLVLDDKNRAIEISKSFGAPSYATRVSKQQAADAAAKAAQVEAARKQRGAGAAVTESLAAGAAAGG
jgi:hypothetical protein